MINYRVVFNVLGVLLIMLAGLMLLAVPFSLYYNEHHLKTILGCAGITGLFGFFFWFITRKADKKIGKREGYLIVAVGWLGVAVFSALPYIISGAIPDISSALFESVSGLTTTGATVLTDIEIFPRGMLFWRSLTQWLGGMGIIVLTVAIFPLLGIGGIELFVAESPGPQSDKIHPRIKETAKRLWLIYVGLTFLLILILYSTGIGFYNAITHALTTMSTGGFSIWNDSIAHFQMPVVEYIIMVFMFIAGINYTIIYFGLKGNFKKVWSSDEFKTYLFLVLAFVAGLSVIVFQVTDMDMETSFRLAAFQVISIVTTTGYVTADYTAWSPTITLFFFGLLFLGACAGSTSGGIKIIRHLVFFKNSVLELKRLLHPKAIIRNKIDGQVVPPRILMHILVFLLFYMILFIIGSLVMAIILEGFDRPLLSAVGAAATALGNVGPSIGSLGPMDNFALVPAAGKWVLMALMLLGRLELFTLLILFSPYFWRVN